MTNPRQHTWQPISSPVTIPVKWKFDKQSYEKLVAGVESRGMDDRWDVDFNDGAVHFYRSWTGYQVYSLTLRQDGEDYLVDGFEIDRDSMAGNSEEDVKYFSSVLKYAVGVEPHDPTDN